MLRPLDPATAGPLRSIRLAGSVDQPYAHVFTHRGPIPPDNDRLYVGYVDRSHKSRTATVDVCLDARAAAPNFNQVPIEFRASFPLDGYEVRPAAHSDGKVYVAYKSWRFLRRKTVIADIV